MAAALLVLPPIALAAPPPASASALQYEALPLERSRQEQFLVRAHINGRPALLVVDTGAPVSAIALNRRAHFRMAPTTARAEIPSRININGAFNSVAIARHLQLGALTLVDEPMVLLNLSGPGPNSSDRDDKVVDGIIGTDILLPTKAIIDCERQLLVLKIDPRIPGTVPGYDFRGYGAVKMRASDAFNLYVKSSVNGKATSLVVDTGAFAILLHSNFMERMKIPLRETPFISSAVNLKQRGIRLATVERLSVGSLDMQRNDVAVVNLDGVINDGSTESSPPMAGLLGSEFLRRYHAIIDCGTRTLYLKR